MSTPPRIDLAFGALVLAQVAHSVEEYVGRLWEFLPPARFMAGLFSSDLQRGFLIGNVLIVAFGLWCFFWPVRRRWPAAISVAWGWAIVETCNGIGHSVFSVIAGSYTPGLATAPLLILFAAYLARRLYSARTS